jgi:capsule biosynthesis phosphatase
MNVVIPLGGRGQRFVDEGYTLPKPLVRVLGKPLLFWVLDSLRLRNEDTLFIAYNVELDAHRFADEIRRHYPSVRLVAVKHSSGALETLLRCVEQMSATELAQPLVSLDGDTRYACDVLEQCREGGNAIACFEDDGPPIYSYTVVGDDGRVTGVAEKVRVSNNANSGCYVFESGQRLKEYCEKVLGECVAEPYTSQAFRAMLKDDLHVRAIRLRASDVECLGTPHQVRLFCRAQSPQEQRRYCFDLDNTLVTYPEVHGDYATVRPIPRNIEYARFLKSLGHTIIIHTARRMKTHAGNVGAVVADVGAVTLETLRRFDIPCDELVFGKPLADAYIDDLAIDAFANMEQSTGFYMPELTHGRSFNKVERSGEVVCKSAVGDGLAGEVFFYENIPHGLEKMFPRFYGSDKGTYKMEAIHGTALSDMLVSGTLRVSDMCKVFEALRTLHASPSDPAIDIYANYGAKLRARFASYDYARFSGADALFQELSEGLNDYERRGRGRRATIHGDAVFGNMLLDFQGSVKFIDMRGKQGNVLTTTGDALYDYAKVYQSLTGYDFVLNGKSIPDMGTLQDAFWEWVGDDALSPDIRLITRSLYMSLIPLHDNERCSEYFRLAKTLGN